MQDGDQHCPYNESSKGSFSSALTHTLFLQWPNSHAAVGYQGLGRYSWVPGTPSFSRGRPKLNWVPVFLGDMAHSELKPCFHKALFCWVRRLRHDSISHDVFSEIAFLLQIIDLTIIWYLSIIRTCVFHLVWITFAAGSYRPKSKEKHKFHVVSRSSEFLLLMRLAFYWHRKNW